MPDRQWLQGIRGLPTSAIVTSIFGMIWINQGMSARSRFEPYGSIAIIIGLIFLIFSIRSLALGRRALNAVHLDGQAKLSSSTMRKYGVTVAIEFALIFIAYFVLTNDSLSWAIIPAVSLIVGLHFFPLARIFRQRSMLIVGAIITFWTVAILFTFPDTAQYQWFVTGIGAGLVLFVATARNLMRANVLIHQVQSMH